MLKRFFLAAIFSWLLSPLPSFAAGTVPGFSLTTQFDLTGKLAGGCILKVIQAGTTATPQIAYQDSALTIPVPGGDTLTCDAIGRLPQFFLADGQIKFRLLNKDGTQIFSQDNLLVVGPSSGGGGGGGGVDPTTVLQTGAIMPFYGTGVMSGFVRLNGRTIGSATSGASERANADCQALFVYLWSTDPNLAVSTGRGASASADWAANKQITLPDWRGRALAALDDMGSSAAGRLTTTYFGTSATVLGAAGGSQSHTQTIAEMAAHSHGVVLNDPGHTHGHNAAVNSGGGVGVTGGGSFFLNGPGGATINSAFTNIGIGSASGVNDNRTTTIGSGTTFSIANPMMLATFYLKL